MINVNELFSVKNKVCLFWFLFSTLYMDMIWYSLFYLGLFDNRWRTWHRVNAGEGKRRAAFKFNFSFYTSFISSLPDFFFRVSFLLVRKYISQVVTQLLVKRLPKNSRQWALASASPFQVIYKNWTIYKTLSKKYPRWKIVSWDYILFILESME